MRTIRTAATITDTGADVVAARTQPRRKKLMILNNDDADSIYIGLGEDAAATDAHIKVGPGRTFEDEGESVTHESIHIITASGLTAPVVVIEWV